MGPVEAEVLNEVEAAEWRYELAVLAESLGIAPDALKFSADDGGALYDPEYYY